MTDTLTLQGRAPQRLDKNPAASKTVRGTGSAL